MAGKQFLVKVPYDSAYTLQAKNLVEITLSHTVSEKLNIFHFHCEEKL